MGHTYGTCVQHHSACRYLWSHAILLNFAFNFFYFHIPFLMSVGGCALKALWIIWYFHTSKCGTGRSAQIDAIMWSMHGYCFMSCSCDNIVIVTNYGEFLARAYYGIVSRSAKWLQQSQVWMSSSLVCLWSKRLLKGGWLWALRHI